MTTTPLTTNMLPHGVAVVGGGPGGLAAAIALHRLGIRQVVVYECLDEIAFSNTHAGAGIQLTPNGLTALQFAAGDAVVQQVLQHAAVIQTVVMAVSSNNSSSSSSSSSTTTSSTPFEHVRVIPHTVPNAPYPTVMIRWGILRQILASQLPAGCIVCGTTVTGYQKSDNNHNNNNTIRLQLDHTNWSEHAYSLVLFANGKASSFRSSPLTCHATDPRINIKAAVNFRPPHLLNPTTAYTFFTPSGIACFVGSTGGTSDDNNKWTHWGISVPTACMPFGCPETTGATVSSPQTKADLERIQSHVLHLLDTAASSNNPTNPNNDPSSVVLAAECAVVRQLVQATPAVDIVVHHSTTADLTDSFCVGNHEHETENANANTNEHEHENEHENNNTTNMILLGDAAHAMSYSHGQLTSFAFEDAATVAYCLQQQSQQSQQPQSQSSSLAKALLEYSQRRHVRCWQLQQSSQERAARAMRGERDDGSVIRWIHEWSVTTTDTANATTRNNDNNHNNNNNKNHHDQEEDEDTHMTVIG